jgi:hypothetical protein
MQEYVYITLSGFISGICAVFLFAIVVNLKSPIIRTKLYNTQINKEDIITLEEKGLPIDLILNSHIETTMKGHQSDILALMNLYKEHGKELHDSHMLRDVYIERLKEKDLTRQS